MNCGVANMALVKRKEIALNIAADIENAAAGAEQNAANIEDVMTALVELADLITGTEEDE